MHLNLQNKHIILGITGGIAAYKSAVLARLLVKAGAEVQVIMTPHAREFIAPVTMSALTGKPVVTQFFSANSGEWHSHVDLGLWADAMVIAPATACTIGKMATGVADNMLVTSYLSAKCPVFVAPAMDLDMMAHPSTSRNLATLAADGVHIIEPATGELASHLTGRGRMEEPERIVAVLEEFFAAGGDLPESDLPESDLPGSGRSMERPYVGRPYVDDTHAEARPFAGRKVLITAGPTVERIDPVRYISNFSTGKMGYALAAEAARRGAEVVLVSGPCALSTPAGVRRIDVESACQMLAAVEAEVDTADVAIMAAAVADYAPAEYIDHKIKRESDGIESIALVKNPDIARTVGQRKHPGQILVGFALETDHGAENAVKKLEAKNLDMVVLNSLADAGAGFGTDTNKVSIFFASGRAPVSFELKDKAAVAADILDVILNFVIAKRFA